MTFKKRTGFCKIVMSDLNTYQFSWTKTRDLILYSEDDTKIVISYDKLWDNVAESDEYKNAEAESPSWRGKRKIGPVFQSFDKRKARELFRKYLSIT